MRRGKGYKIIDRLGQDSWKDVLAHRRNKSDLWLDVKNGADESLTRIMNLARKLPDKKHKEVFEYAKVVALFNALLSNQPRLAEREELVSRRQELEQKIRNSKTSKAVVNRWKSESKRLHRKIAEIDNGVDISRLDIAARVLMLAISYIDSQCQTAESNKENLRFRLAPLEEIRITVDNAVNFIKMQYLIQTKLREEN